MKPAPRAFQREHDALRAILDLRLKRPDLLLFRNQVGFADYGSRGKVPYGLAKGSADIIGIQARVITEADVGHLAGVFLSIEAKSITGQPTPEQLQWARLIRRYGAVSMIVRGPAEVERALELPLAMPRE